ncbi:integumentary mucin C.1-like [Sycon ciliatum]|uniref:integumentary mucin C.1-like n=1 Tax=Sycon ciliatum TaxID=27933 RepID=UPI0031F670BC
MSAAGAETKRCPNCRQDVSVNLYATMHEPRCRRFNRFCEQCNEPIEVADFDRHVAEDHKQMSCPDCGDCMEGLQLDDHQEEECRKRLVTCKYCELDWQCDELPEHSSLCGSRTDECSLCHTRVRLSDMEWHMTEKHGVHTSHSSASAASSPLPSTGKQSASGSSKPSSTHCSASQAAAQPPATAAASLKLSGSQPPHAKTTTPPDAEWGVTEVPASASASLAASSTNTTTATQQAKRRVPRSTQQTKSPPAAAAGNARGPGAYGSLSGSVTSSSVAAGAANTLSSSQLTGSTSNSSRASAANSRASVTSSTATSNPPLSSTSSSSKKTTTSSSKKTTGSSSSSRSTASLSGSSLSVKQASSARSNGAHGSTVTPSTSSASMASNSRSGLSCNTPKHNGGSAPFAAAAGPPPQADTQNAVGASSTSYFEGCSSDPNDVPVPCEFCEVEVRLGDLYTHEVACARREQRCTGCGMSFRGIKLPQHRRTGCSRELQAPAALSNAAAAAGGGGYGTTSFPGFVEEKQLSYLFGTGIEGMKKSKSGTEDAGKPDEVYLDDPFHAKLFISEILPWLQSVPPKRLLDKCQRQSLLTLSDIRDLWLTLEKRGGPTHNQALVSLILADGREGYIKLCIAVKEMGYERRLGQMNSLLPPDKRV